jgi:LysM repeat protein
MSLDRIYSALANYLVGTPPDQSIDLVAAARDAALMPLGIALRTARIEGTFVLSSAKLRREATSVQVEGNATWLFVGGKSTLVHAVLEATDDLYSLSLRPLEVAWTFGRTFLELPVTAATAPGSLLTDLTVVGPAFTTTASGSGQATSAFSGSLPQMSVDARIRGYFGPYPLEIAGPLELPRAGQPYPTMVLFAKSPDTRIGVPPLALSEPGIRVISRTNDGYPLRSQFEAESLLQLSATLEVGDATGDLTGSLSGAGAMWPLSLVFAPGEVTIGGTLALLAGLLGLAPDDLSLPKPFPAIGNLSLTEIDAGIYPAGPTIDHVGVTVETAEVWHPPVPFLVDKVSVSGVGTRWVAYWAAGQSSPSAISGSVFGIISIGKSRPLNLLVTAYLPDFVIEALQDGGEEADLGDVIEVFFGRRPGGVEVSLSSMSLIGDLRARTFRATLVAGLDATIPFGPEESRITLSSIGLGIRAGGGGLGANLTALFVIGALDAEDSPKLSLSASYESGKAWRFAGGLQPGAPLKLTELASRFVGNTEVPPDAVDLQVDVLWFTFDTGRLGYTFAGAISARWSPELFGRRITMTAGVAVEASRADRNAPQLGSITGTFSIDRLTVTAAMSLKQPKQPTYLFRVDWDGTWISAITAWRTDPTTAIARQVITLTLGGKTLGELITYLANLALPGSNFTLEAPWDLLNRIELSAFAVTIDPGAGAVELTYDANVDLGFASISRIGLRYARANGQGTVKVILAGTVVGRTYPPDKPLSWDVLAQRPPATPGASGGGTLEVRFLGVGQRVALTGPLPTTVGEAVARLAATMKEPPSPSPKPLPSGVGYASSAGWLVGLDVSVLDTVDLALLFADPVLYGMSVGLRGKRAGPLAGLRFEILYRKISDDVGVYRIELRVPDAFRRIDVGVMSVTIGIAVVEIYTNGNFKVDLGFPFKQDFSRSFGLSYLPFIGRGGFYLGVLDGTTSSRVPRVTNGAFSPVLEAGIGLAIGVGKEFSVGPISGGVSVEARVIFEGVFAWFNPSDASAAPSMYVWVAGLAGIYGKLTGRADFGVIVVNVTVDAWAEARVVFEMYRPAVFALNVGVRVYASVDFWFFVAEFSFDLRLETSITVGSTEPTPWLLAADQTTASRAAMALPPLSRRPSRRRTLVGAELTAALARKPAGWRHLKRRIVDAELRPAFSASGITVGWNKPVQPLKPGNTSPYRVVFGLGIRSGADARLARGSTSDLVELLFRYALQLEGLVEDSVVSVGHLDALAERLRTPATIDGPFGIDAISAFFDQTLELRIGGRPAGQPQKATGTLIPLPPFLRWHTETQEGDLAKDFPIGADYIRDVATYVDQYLPGPPRSAPVSDSTAVESFATWAFRDWCLMVARSAVDAAQGALRAWEISSPRTLRSAALLFPSFSVSYAVRSGDTLSSVAASVGASPGELVFLQPDIEARIAAARPGSVLTLRLGVSPGSLAGDNVDLPLRAGRSVPLGRIAYSIRPADTIAAIAKTFGLAGPAAAIAGAAADPRLLLPGCRLTIPALAVPRKGRSAVLVAATYFGRYAEPALEQTPWYVEALGALNRQTLKRASSRSLDGSLPPGLALVLPVGDGDPRPGDRYRTIIGDTVERIAVAVCLAQNYASGSAGPTGWPKFRNSVQAMDGLQVPTWAVFVRTGESFAALAKRLVTDTRTAAQWFAGIRGLLAPLAALPLRRANGQTKRGDTLGSLATRYGLDVEVLGDRLARTAMLVPGAVLVARHLLGHRLDDLASRVASAASSERITGLAARLLLGGIQLPQPTMSGQTIRAADELLPFAELTRQQMVGPVPDPAKANATALRVEFEPTTQIGWVQLRATTTKSSGAIVRGHKVRALEYAYTNAELLEAYPPLTMTVCASFGPAPLQASTSVPRTYGLERRIALHSTLPLPVPGASPIVGSASLWPFPATLIERARTGTPDRYDVIRLRTRDDLDPNASVLQDVAFASFIQFGIRQLDENPVYALVGVAPGDRELLADMVQARPVGSGRAFLIVRPAPDAADAAGRMVWADDPASTYLLMTNEATETVIPPGVPAAFASGFHASLESAAAFARLLWQGSTVGGIGYYLGTATRLPAAAFDASGLGQLALMFVPEQSAPTGPGLPLRPFLNAALVGAQTAPTVHALYVESADDGDVATRAVVAPGEAGYSLVLEAPRREDRAGRLFSLVGWSMPLGPSTPSAPVRPAPPTYGRRSEPEPIRPWDRARRARRREAGRTVRLPTEDSWLFEAVVPVARYGPVSPVPAVPGLPPAEDDPYRAVSASHPEPAVFELTFSDVFGNRSSAAASVAAPLAYVDEIQSPQAWPALSTSFDVATDLEGRPIIRISLEPQAGAWLQDGSEPPSIAAARLKAQGESYRSAVYQFLPPRVRIALSSTLIPGREPHLEAWPLWRYAVAGHLATTAAAALEPVRAGPSVAAILAAHEIAIGSLASANSELAIESLWDVSDLAVPAVVPFAEGDTPVSIVSDRRPGWPKPASPAALLLLNAELPLRHDAVLGIPAVQIGVRSRTLAQVADDGATTPVLLAEDSRDTRLASGFTFEWDGASVSTASSGPSTFASVVAALAEQGAVVTVADLAVRYSTSPGLLRPKSRVTSRHYVARSWDTLAENDSGRDAAALANANSLAPNLFENGTLICLGDFPTPTAHTGETLGAFATRFGCPSAVLLARNANVRFQDGGGLIVPGVTQQPAASTRVPYPIAVNDTLSSIAQRFGTHSGLLGHDNAEMPAILQPGRTVLVVTAAGSARTTTTDGDSLASVLERIQDALADATLDDVLAAIASVPGMLQAGAVLSCPPGLLRRGTVSPEEASAQFGISAELLAAMNASLDDLVVPGARLAAAGVEVTTIPGDTLGSLVRSFVSKLERTGGGGVAPTLADIIAANAGRPFLRGGSRVLLPPAPVILPVRVDGADPLPDPIAPLQVTLRLSRERDLVDPRFWGSPVELTEVPLRPAIAAGSSQAVSTDGFASRFLAAFPSLRLATGQAKGADGDLWVVSFGRDGIERVDFGGAGSPRFFALRPLYDELVTRTNVPIAPLLADGTLGPPVPTTFAGVDAELWARQFLADFDRFLEAPLASAAYRDHGLRPLLDRLLAHKRNLASRIADGLDATFADQAPDDAARVAAVEVLRQALLVSLSAGYDTNAVVQFEADVESGWRREGAAGARLVGTLERASSAASASAVTLTSAKLGLARGREFLTSRLLASDPAAQASISLRARYEVANLEHGIHEVVDGYEASDWLTFAPALAGDTLPKALASTAFEEVLVPIPLRTYPQLPQLIGQVACASESQDPPPLERAALWDYAVTYSHEHAAQDEVAVTTHFNASQPTRTDDLMPDVATALARYTAVAPPLWDLLGELGGPAGAVARPLILNAVGVLELLVGDIVLAWSAGVRAGLVDEPQGGTSHTVSVSLATNSAGGRRLYASATLLAGGSGPGPGRRWPEILFHPATGPALPLVRGVATGGRCTYAFPLATPVEPGVWPRLTITWPELSVTEFERARASVAVRRNLHLAGPTGPRTAPAFVLRSGDVATADAVTPLLEWSAPVDITSYGETFAEAIAKAVTQIFGTHDLPLTVSAELSYALVTAPLGGTGVTTTLPALLFRMSTSEVVTDLAPALEEWLERNPLGPAAGARSWKLALTLDAQDPGAERRALLRLGTVVFRSSPAYAGPA